MTSVIQKQRILYLIVFSALISASNSELISATCLDAFSCTDQYNLCLTCESGIVTCESNVPTLTCNSCKTGTYPTIPERDSSVLYCSETQGCSSINKSTGDCESCANGYFANVDTSGTTIKIICQTTAIVLIDILKKIESATSQTPAAILAAKLSVLKSYTTRALYQSPKTSTLPPLFYFARNSKDCNSSSRSSLFYERCLCKSDYFGSRCQAEKSAIVSLNTEATNIFAGLANYKTTLTDNTLPMPDPNAILDIFIGLSELADGFTDSTLNSFDTAFDSFSFLTLDFTTYWSLPLTTTSSTNAEYTNLGLLFAASSTRTSQLIKSIVSSANQTSGSSLTAPTATPITKLTAVIQYYYEQTIATKLTTLGGGTSNALQIIRGSKVDLYFQVIVTPITPSTYSSITSTAPTAISFYDIASLTDLKCSTDFIDYPYFFISSRANTLFETQSNTFTKAFFVNQYSFNPYPDTTSLISSPIIKIDLNYNTQSTGQTYAKLSTFTVSLQEDYLAVLIPKFRTTSFSNSSITSTTCKIYNESTEKWSSSSELGVINNKTISCNTHVICFYDLQKSLVKGRQFAFQLEFGSTTSKSLDYWSTIDEDFTNRTGFIIPMCLIAFLLILILMFLYVHALNTYYSPTRKIQIQESSDQKSELRRNKAYEMPDNLFTEKGETEGNIFDTNKPRSQSDTPIALPEVLESIELNPFLTFHFSSIAYTNEKTYKIQKIFILIMNWMFLSFFLAFLFHLLDYSDINVVRCIAYTIFAGWIFNYVWGTIAVLLRKTRGGSPSVNFIYYVLWVALFGFLFYLELHATADFIGNDQGYWHWGGFLICIVIEYLIFDVILLFLYEYLATNQQSKFYSIGKFITYRGFYQQ